MDNLEISRNAQLLEKLIIIDGFPGCGKTMLSPIISKFNRVEIMQYSDTIEQICELHFLGKIGLDVAKSIISTHADRLLYSISMGRDLNCRPSDISSIFNDRPLKYIKRMLSKGDEAILQKIKNNKPILHLTTHMLFPNFELLNKAFDEKMFFIEVVRHPLYMIIQKEKNFSMYEGVRSGHIRYTYQNKEYTFFTKGWENKFDISNSFEKAVYCMEWYFNELISFTDKKNNLLVLPFEKFVKFPDKFINIISDKIKSPINKKVKYEMKKQTVPRKLISDGPSLEIYKRCGWEPPKYFNENDELNARRKLVEKNVSREAMRVIDNMSDQYFKRFNKFI